MAHALMQGGEVVNVQWVRGQLNDDTLPEDDAHGDVTHQTHLVQ